MLELLIRLVLGYWHLLDGSARDAADAWDNQDWVYFFRSMGLMLLLLFFAIGSGIFLVLLLWKLRSVLLAVAIPPVMLALLIASYYENSPRANKASGNLGIDNIDEELARQEGLEMQDYAIRFMLRVLNAIAPFTPIIRPRSERDIEISAKDGALFYMDGPVTIFQAEVGVEGEITPEVEETIRREVQRYARKYIPDYPMLISQEAGGHSPVEILSVKSCGNRVLIDYVFTSAASLPMIKARRRARIERQKRAERIDQYIDEDYGE